MSYYDTRTTLIYQTKTSQRSLKFQRITKKLVFKKNFQVTENIFIGFAENIETVDKNCLKEDVIVSHTFTTLNFFLQTNN